MANPEQISFQDNFESGDFSGWSVGEVDTEDQLDVVHYTTLAKIPGMPMPYSGAYCLRAQLTGSGAPPADAITTEADIDINTTMTNWVQFNIWIDPDFKTNTTADDNFALFEFQDTADKEIFVFGLDYTLTTNVLKWGVGGATDNAVPDTLSAAEVPLGKWLTVELSANLVTAGATGTISAYVTEDGQEPSETVTVTKGSVQGLTITHGVLGAQDHKATTIGTILIDGFQYSGKDTVSGARIYPTKDRFSTTRQFLSSGLVKELGSFHAFVGQGTVSNVTWLTGGGTAAFLSVYDTDTAQTGTGDRKAALTQSLAGEVIDVANVPFNVTRGCYVEIDDSGNSNQEVIVTIERAPNWFSDGNMRRYAHRRNLGG
jgi:hypothetical protein